MPTGNFLVICMFTNVKTPCGVYRSRLLFVALMTVGLLFVALIPQTLVVNAEESSLKKTVHVKTETELTNAVKNALEGVPVIIALDKDIILTKGALFVRANIDITLTSNNKTEGFCRLIGAKNYGSRLTLPTISVEGLLRLDGVIVTHSNDVKGRGIYVDLGGVLILYEGKISDNVSPYYEGADHDLWVDECRGSGVYNEGFFEMFGGEITNNYASDGGSVYNCGIFTMYCGRISNKFCSGVSNIGVFEMFGGEIAYNRYGGVGNYGNFTMYDGKIFGNRAFNGGGVYNSGNFTYDWWSDFG
jgi:hypothetical protein